jgi:hypothetical protein
VIFSQAEVIEGILNGIAPRFRPSPSFFRVQDIVLRWSGWLPEHPGNKSPGEDFCGQWVGTVLSLKGDMKGRRFCYVNARYYGVADQVPEPQALEQERRHALHRFLAMVAITPESEWVDPGFANPEVEE